jgi:hypothetical protein
MGNSWLSITMSLISMWVKCLKILLLGTKKEKMLFLRKELLNNKKRTKRKDKDKWN